MKRHLLTIFILLATIFCVGVPVARAELTSEISAQTQSAAGQKGANFGAPRDPRMVAAKTVEVMLGLLGTVFLAYLIYAGVLILISQGDEEKIKQGKKIIIWSTLGIFVVLSAYSITLLVDRYLHEAQGVQDDQGVFFDNASFTVDEDMSDFYNTDPLNQDTIQSGSIWDQL